MTAATTELGLAGASPVGIAEVRRRVESVPDPELPVLTLGQLGVVRSVELDAAAGAVGDPAGEPADDRAPRLLVEITPTYSGCPALEVMVRDIEDVVRSGGYQPVVRRVLSPAWTTDWISAEGRTALREAGIAPPGRSGDGRVALSIGRRPQAPSCPQCGAGDTEELARFGSTSCKALWRCRACGEPFDYVKPL